MKSKFLILFLFCVLLFSTFSFADFEVPAEIAAYPYVAVYRYTDSTHKTYYVGSNAPFTIDSASGILRFNGPGKYTSETNLPMIYNFGPGLLNDVYSMQESTHNIYYTGTSDLFFQLPPPSFLPAMMVEELPNQLNQQLTIIVGLGILLISLMLSLALFPKLFSFL